jgi:D-threonine aldolase
VHIVELQTPALVIGASALEHNLKLLSGHFPGATLRPHVKAHKSTDIAKRQSAYGHHGFTCATIREVEVLAQAGLGADLLLANEVADASRLGLCAEATGARITVAVDSGATVDAAAQGGVSEVLIDVNIGLPRCGVDPANAGTLADYAKSKGLTVRGVMGYEGHLMMVLDPEAQRAKVAKAFGLLQQAHAAVGGDVVSGGGTGTFAIHHDLGVLTEIQCGSYALMDSQYAQHGFGFRQAIALIATVIAISPQGWAVADCGLKAQGMDHGNPTIHGADVLFCSDEHVTFVPAPDGPLAGLTVGSRIVVIPAHCDPTVAYHEQYWVVEALDAGDPDRGQAVGAANTLESVEVLDRWPVDMRGW